MVAAIATALLSSTFAAGLLAQPAPAPVRFAWVRGRDAGSCSSQRQVEDKVAARLGRDPFSTGHAEAKRTIDVYVTRSEDGFRAEIFVRDQDGQLEGSRELTSSARDCAPIELASVLAVALVIDPDADSRPPVPKPMPAPARPVEALSNAVAGPSRPPPFPGVPLPRPPPPPSMVEAPKPSTALGSLGAALHADLGLGLLPRVAAGVSLATYVPLDRKSVV